MTTSSIPPRSTPTAAATPKADVTKVETTEIQGSKQNVFFNYDETLTQGELKTDFQAIGEQPERPNAKHFSVSGAHANGSTKSRLDVGVSFTNTEAKGGPPLVLFIKDTRAANAPKNDKGQGLDPTKSSPANSVKKVAGGWEVTVPPGATVQVPLATVQAHAERPPPANPKAGYTQKENEAYQQKFVRDGSRMVTYSLDVTVKSGNPASVAVNDIARHPQSTAVDAFASPAMPKQWKEGQDAWEKKIDPKHHQGIFAAREAKPVSLAPGKEAGLVIGKIDGEAAYNTPHTFRLQFPEKNLPHTLVFRGGGGPTLPRVGTQEQLLPMSVSPTKSYEVSMKDALKQGLIKQVGPGLYELQVKFVPGNNGNLNVSGKW
ncbi:MAG TPA: hypothetical protein VF815_45565 [Myxococcaceae bacterium]|jgi:hypothetical protein